ncbi:hypothetical protein [Metabacillus fastidiosus]|uniref:hypothetical protein n=1 Tax=Metabacillus fastidiosus TaxID=1458 RepID=UPI003D2E26F5
MRDIQLDGNKILHKVDELLERLGQYDTFESKRQAKELSALKSEIQNGTYNIQLWD